MTAQEYLDELERLRKAAIMPPYYLRKKLFFGEDEEEYYITDKEERIICRMKYMSTEPDNAAYIVAACNAVPTSKPPTRRITMTAVALPRYSTSKPPTRRITRGFYKSISAFQ